MPKELDLSLSTVGNINREYKNFKHVFANLKDMVVLGN